MIDWKSPAEIAKDALVFDRFMHALLGVYVWEWLISLDFDWQFVTGRKPFRWPMIFYFFGRYSLLFALIGIVTSLNMTSEVNCQALYTFNALFGNAAIGFASVNLAFRTMAVWSRQWFIVIPLTLVIFGHWSLLLHGVNIKTVWVPGEGCIITNTNTTVLVATWIYSMIFDFVVLSLTAVKLIQPGSGSRSNLVDLIFTDGLIYFLAAFLSNVVATIFMLLNLNPVMSVIANVPAAVVSTIVACRVVRRLSNFTSFGVEVFPTTVSQGTTLAYQSGVRPKISTKGPKDGVRVQMETFQSPVSDKSTFAEDDASGRTESYDPESLTVRSGRKDSPY